MGEVVEVVVWWYRCCPITLRGFNRCSKNEQTRTALGRRRVESEEEESEVVPVVVPVVVLVVVVVFDG